MNDRLPYISRHREGHSSTAVESGVEKMEHVAQVILSYSLLLAPSIYKHSGLAFVLGLGSKYNSMCRDDMAEDIPSLHTHIIPTRE